MKAAVRYRYGSPDVVSIQEVERPVPSDDQVLVRVHAASVNRADLDGIAPRPEFVRLFLGLRAPRNPRLGLDAAGTVEATGPEVTRFQPGDRVFADLFLFGPGGLRRVRLHVRESVPADSGRDELRGRRHTAALRDPGRAGAPPPEWPVDPGRRQGADRWGLGNVGPFAVQIAKAMGAEVTGVCSTEKLEFVSSLGADRVIDYTTTDYTTTGERYHWILDTDSHHPILDVRRALRRDGVYVTLGGTSWPIIGALLVAPVVSMASSRHMGLLLWWKPFNADDVQTVMQLVAEGTVKPAIDRRFPLEEVASALKHVDEGRAKGKVVVTVGEPQGSPSTPAAGNTRSRSGGRHVGADRST